MANNGDPPIILEEDYFWPFSHEDFIPKMSYWSRTSKRKRELRIMIKYKKRYGHYLEGD